MLSGNDSEEWFDGMNNMLKICWRHMEGHTDSNALRLVQLLVPNIITSGVLLQPQPRHGPGFPSQFRIATYPALQLILSLPWPLVFHTFSESIAPAHRRQWEHSTKAGKPAHGRVSDTNINV